MNSGFTRGFRWIDPRSLFEFDEERHEQLDHDVMEIVEVVRQRISKVRKRVATEFGVGEYLDLSGLHGLLPIHLAQLGEVAGLAGVKRVTLSLDGNRDLKGFAEMVASPAFAELESVGLRHDRAGVTEFPAASALVRAVAKSKIRLREVETLNIHWDEGACTSIHSLAPFETLTHFSATYAQFTQKAGCAFFSKESPIRLQRIETSDTAVPEKMARSLAESPMSESLLHLLLWRSELNDAALGAILSQPFVSRLETFGFTEGTITDDGARALLAAPLDAVKRIALFPLPKVSVDLRRQLCERFKGKFLDGNERYA